MKNKSIIICFFILGCKAKMPAQMKIESINTKDTIMIKKVLGKQLLNGANQYIDDAGVEMPKKPFTDEELDAAVSIAKNILTSNGYKFPKIVDFNTKIKNMFGRKIDTALPTKYLYVDFLNRCNTVFNHHPNNRIDYEGTNIIKNENFITDFYYLPQLVDYHKKYPDVAKVEGTMHLKGSSKYGNISIETWTGLENHEDSGYNLQNVRQKNIECLVARNMYLFNNNNAFLPWLKLNDKNFLAGLVTKFGYTEDTAILKWVLETTPKYDHENIEEIAPLFFHKNCDDTYNIHTSTLKLIEQINTPEKNKDIGNANKIIREFFIDKKYCHFNDIPFKERAKIVAYLLAFGEQYKYQKEFNYNQLFIGQFIVYQDFNHLYRDEFAKNNYYNLPHLKEWLQAAEKEKDIFANDTQLNDNPQTEDYLRRAGSYKLH